MKFAKLRTDGNGIPVNQEYYGGLALKTNTEYLLYAEEVGAEPEKCVWQRTRDDDGWQPTCIDGQFAEDGAWERPPKILDGQKVSKDKWLTYCYACGREIEFKHPEPTIPPGYREPEEWGKECAEPPEGTLWWKETPQVWDEWDVQSYSWPYKAKTIVPASWTPLPKCRDCGGETAIETMGNSHIYYVRCNKNDGCTVGPTKINKAEAVKAYPKGE